MTAANTDFGRVADDLRRAAGSFALLTSSATAFGAALNSFRQFERQLTLTNAIAGGTVEQFNRMKEAARGFSLVTTVSAIDAGVALQQLAQAGFSAEESLSAMNGVLLLSQATLTDVGVTADVLSSNIRAFGLEAGDTTRVANVFTATITGSLATMDKLAFAFRQVAPVAELAGLSIEETSAALGTLFNVGLRGEQAGTALRNVIIRLIRPLGEANDLLQNAGIATRNASGDLRNLADILRDIGQSDLTNADLARIFETEALAGVKALINALQDVDETGSDAFQRLLKNVTGTDRALEIAAQNLDTFDGSIRLLQNNLSDVAKSIGEQLAGPLRTFSELIISVIDTFRALDPETQQLIATTAGYTAGAVLLLGVLNALALLMRGPLLTAFVTLGSKGLSPLLKGFTAAAKGIATFVAGLVAVSTGAGGLTIAAGASTVAVRALTASFVAFLATPVGAGIALIVTGLASLSAALFLATSDARAASAELERLSALEFQQASADARAVTESILPQGAVKEVENRIKQLNNQLALLGTVGGPADIAGTATRKSNEIEELQAQINASTAEREEAASDLAELDAQSEALVEAYFNSLEEFGAGTPEANSAIRQLNEFVEGLNTADRAELAELARARNVNEAQVARLDEALAGFGDGRQEAIAETLVNLARGEENGLSESVQAAAQLLAGSLDTTPAVIAELAARIDERVANGRDFELAVLEEALRETGLPIEEIVPLLIAKQQEDAIALDQAFAGLASANQGIFDTAQQALLENTLATTNDIVEAARVAQELGNLELEAGLADVAAELRANYDEILSQFGIDQQDGLIEAFNNARNAVDEITGDPSFSEVFSGQAILNAINEQISADSTPEQIAQIIDEQFEIYAQLMADFINAMIAAGTITQDQANAISAAFKNSADAAKAAAIAGLEGSTTQVAGAVKAATNRIKRASGGGGGRKRGGGGGGGGDPAKDALRDARKIEDAFRNAERQSLKARESFLENVEGLDVNSRIQIGLELETEKINQDADRTIQQLKRKLEDLELDGKATDALKQRYAEVIKEIERARDAEIRAANSFDAQMKRRSEALDLFIRDLKTAANEAEGTFAKIAAGIGVAFAEYNKDLVTLVDITSNAVTGFLDAVTTGVADFIFDNENAFENFKATMLNLSRQIFEGFTKALLQQVISSLTDGGGSIFGNLLQPSKGNVGGANDQAPSVGTGGILGGLFGGGQEAGPQAGAAQIQQGTAAIAQSLQQGAVQINQALSQVGVQTRAGGQQLQGGLRQTAQGTQQGGRQVASSLRDAGSQIGSAAGQASNSIRSQSGGGGGGAGIFGFLGGLLGFAQGGLVSTGNVAGLQSIARYAEGGSVVGAGTGTSDDILAFLSNGEFVVNAKMTKEFMPLLEAINSGALKGDVAGSVLQALGKGNQFGGAFAEGGLVGGADSFNGPPSISLTTPRPVVVNNGRGEPSNTNVDNSRGGDTYNIRVIQNNGGGGSGGSRETRRSADQLAMRIGAQIERSKKNT